jgi:hypothetical protein
MALGLQQLTAAERTEFIRLLHRVADEWLDDAERADRAAVGPVGAVQGPGRQPARLIERAYAAWWRGRVGSVGGGGPGAAAQDDGGAGGED